MKLKNEYIIREFNGTIYAVRTDLPADQKSEPVVLNETGRILWQALQNGAEEADLVSALTAEYDIDVKKAEEDVASFVRELNATELLQEEK